ncbi:MAG TPA: nuclear transport factor 2 family protein [Acetobacteraceae bacterium]|nr:nuclear transport factor 2 family protein [Acetobacteraceae bacterium]
MKARALVLAVLALSTAPVFADPPQSERTAAAVMKVEHEWLGALQHRDVRTLGRILAAEFIDSDFQGDAVTRTQYLAYFARPAPGPAPRVLQSFEDTRVRFVADDDVAIVTGLVISRPEAASKAGASADPAAVRHSRFTDVFVWRDGRWQAVTGQETHFAPAGS